MKACSKCGETKPLTEFSKKTSCKDGLQRKCKSCASAEHAERRQANPDRVRALERASKIANVENVRARQRVYRTENSEKVAKVKAIWSKANPNKRKAYMAAWNKANPHMATAGTARYRASKLKQTPKWLSESETSEIIRCYELASTYTNLFGVKVHVDHIIPLRGGSVCGLHVPWNLRVLIAADNLKKNATYLQADALSTARVFEDAVGNKMSTIVC